MTDVLVSVLFLVSSFLGIFLFCLRFFPLLQVVCAGKIEIDESGRSLLRLSLIEAVLVEQRVELVTPAAPEVIGLPLDGHWDHDAAYDHRYCFQHGEDEYLLGTPASWMSPTDLRLETFGCRREAGGNAGAVQPKPFRIQTPLSTPPG